MKYVFFYNFHLGVIIIKQAKKIGYVTEKITILLQIFMWCHFNVMLIMGSYAK
jgi:hypothetical protein